MTVRAGPVWAVATAIPTMLSYVPGGGMGSVSCPGPGAPFDRALSAAQQQTRCSYTYTPPSKGQPGDAFQAGWPLDGRAEVVGEPGWRWAPDRAPPEGGTG